MNEGIHAEGTASELQDRVTELVEQQTAISEVLRAIVNSPHDLPKNRPARSVARAVGARTGATRQWCRGRRNPAGFRAALRAGRR
jgi:hypothetical protein